MFSFFTSQSHLKEKIEGCLVSLLWPSTSMKQLTSAQTHKCLVKKCKKNISKGDCTHP